MNKKRYEQEYRKEYYLLWHIEKEDKITIDSYRDLSHLSKDTKHVKIQSPNILQQVFRILCCKGDSTFRQK